MKKVIEVPDMYISAEALFSSLRNGDRLILIKRAYNNTYFLTPYEDGYAWFTLAEIASSRSYNSRSSDLDEIRDSLDFESEELFVVEPNELLEFLNQQQ